MDSLDKQLLTLIQSNFPITPEPFKELALTLGTTEEDVISRLQKLKEEGIIRRIGGIFDSQKLGYFSTLCAIKVPEERIDEVAELINSYPGVTHNYLRQHEYNMWFTLIAPSSQAAEDILEEMRRRTGIKDLINLPAINFFKIKVNFNLNEV
ncbi:putative transcriptional regulator, AsnC family [Thermincola potens JR]|uniref:siroheme decarboxylase n=2 Tax=Thermincola TaxID=278993 RepID=D5XED3_THEPJ|nr:putative transcriptional regulator, AsnC family [Thermincola potens JR]